MRVLRAFFLLCSFAAAALPAAAETFVAGQSFDREGRFINIMGLKRDYSGEENLFGLELDDGTLVKLFFPVDPPEDSIQTGDRVEVTGTVFEEAAYGEGVEVDTLTPLQASALTLAGTTLTGQRKAVLIRVNFSDATVSCSTSDIAGTMWTGTTNVNGLYQAASFNNISWPSDTNGDSQPDVVDVTLGQAVGATCNYSAWASAADTAATNAGANLSQYQHKVYLLPSNVPCSWAGLAYVGCGNFCQVWVSTCTLGDVYAHELGHNLGYDHSSTDLNNDGTIDSEYGDNSCLMGYGGVGWRHFNAPHKMQLGWIPTANVQNVTSSGTYTIVADEVNPATASPTPPAAIQALSIAISGNTSQKYVVSYRTKADVYSASLGATYADRTNIHRFSTFLTGHTFYISSVGDTEAFDDGHGVKVTQLSHNGTYATVQVDIAGSSTPTPTPTSAPTVAPTSTPVVTPSPTATPLPHKRKKVSGRISYRISRSLHGMSAYRLLQVIVTDATGATVQRANPDPRGSFTLSLYPGDYTVTLKRRSSLVALRTATKTVSVGAGKIPAVRLTAQLGASPKLRRRNLRRR